MKAGYTLKQAIEQVSDLAERISAHRRECESCVEMMVFGESEVLCLPGRVMEKERALWKRRCKYAAKREGVTITV